MIYLSITSWSWEEADYRNDSNLVTWSSQNHSHIQLTIISSVLIVILSFRRILITTVKYIQIPKAVCKHHLDQHTPHCSDHIYHYYIHCVMLVCGTHHHNYRRSVLLGTGGQCTPLLNRTGLAVLGGGLRFEFLPNRNYTEHFFHHYYN